MHCNYKVHTLTDFEKVPQQPEAEADKLDPVPEVVHLGELEHEKLGVIQLTYQLWSIMVS